MNPTTANHEKIGAWITRLAEETDAAAQSAELTRYLEVLSRFWEYSARNCWLIAHQRPDATKVASRKTWEQAGRRLKPNAWTRSLQILCPHFRKERDPETGEERQVLTHFSTGYVYDVSQTEGAALPSVPWQQVDGERGRYDLLVAAATRCGITVCERPVLRPGLLGWSTGDGTIVIREDLTNGAKCTTLLHELAHELCHSRQDRQTFSRDMLELHAESIAYCCALALGLPSPNSPTYLALYRIDRERLLANLDAIRAGVARVLRAALRSEEVASSAA